ncbi:sulfatase-like hydrolase/transferase [Pseudonocardia sp. HH130630-07]|uniref:sulfatase-like hydrolase/transferase n=1 Tax=Pseudonocardia sp. HH130630-07 TaxID=1690815 RepID=UPI00081524C2|nr:sulfatase-like hydrolase/transferase [Pseudonocardia sp. HH130630-07]ANY09548.1 hypothetical protein AFB00_28625 [Pseudonocardia sp. HH130630-07]
MPDTRPDIVVVLTDQQRADHSAREGHPLDTTPFADELAREGTWFDRAYTTSPLCSPARTSLWTGRYPTAHRVTQNAAREHAVTGADLFGEARAAGYTTAMVGKNHTWLGPADTDHWAEYTHDGQATGEPGPAEREFDAWLAGLRHRTPDGSTPFPVRVQLPHRIVDDALQWATTVADDRPMLLVVSFPEPHNPYQVPEPYASMFPPGDLPPVTAGAEVLADKPFAWRYLREIGERSVGDYEAAIAPSRSHYAGMLRLIDDEVRRLHDGLAARHTRHERLVVLTSDHGDFAGDYGLVRKGAEIPDVLARVPLVVHGDGVAPGTGSRRDHVSLADLMPTFCEVMGRDLPPGTQGRSLRPMLAGEPYPVAEFASAYTEQGMGGLPYGPDDVGTDHPGLIYDEPGAAPRWDELNAVTQSGRRRRVRSGDWSLQADVTGEFRLCHLPGDPLELVDRWADPDAAGPREELLRLLAVWQMRAEDPLPVVDGGYRVKRDPRNVVAGPWR